MKRCFFILAVISLLLSCQPPQYYFIQITPTFEKVKEGRKTTVAFYPVADLREVARKDQVGIRKKGERTIPIYALMPAAETVTLAVKDYLEAKGVKAIRLAPEAEGGPPEADVIIRGELKELWVEAEGTVATLYKLKITLKFEFEREKKRFSHKVELKTEKRENIFSILKVEKLAKEMVKEAVRRALDALELP